MTNDPAIREKLTQIFRDVFDDETIEIRDTLTANDVASWDSLTHINMIVAVEKAFQIKLTTKEVQSLSNVGELLSLIQRKAT
jgi:acyl carrier protein